MEKGWERTSAERKAEWKDCPACNGTGKDGKDECARCDGSGKVKK